MKSALICLLVIVSITQAIPKPEDEVKSRVIDKVC